MARRAVIVAVVVAWVACGIGAAGTLNAWYRAAAPDLHQSGSQARETWGASVALGAFGPVTLLLGGLLSGLWHDGWTLTMQPFECTLEPDIWCDQPKRRMGQTKTSPSPQGDRQ